MNAHIASVAAATPPCAITQREAERFLLEHYGDRLGPRNLSVMRKVFAHPGIKKRHYAFESPDCLLREGPDDRIARFTRWAVELSADCSLKALDGAGLMVKDVSAVVVNTCTGYICPGVSTYLLERLGLSPRTLVYDLVGCGCGGAAPNLQIAGRIAGSQPVVREGGVVLSVSVEICSATFQMGDDLSLIVSNALFGDGAAAAVLWSRPEGMELVDSASRYAPEHRDAIRYVHKNGELHNQLSMSLHRLVKVAVRDAVGDVLGPRGLSPRDVKHWALHAGGEKIINTVRDELGLSEEQLGPTRGVLAEYGNMSSPTVLFVLRDILDAGVGEDEWCVMATFGAGLSAHAFLLRKRPGTGGG